MGIRNQRRYGEIPDEDDLDDSQESEKIDTKVHPKASRNTRQEPKKGHHKRSIFDFFLTLVGKLVYGIFVYIPKSLFRLFRGKNNNNDEEPRHLMRKFLTLCLKGGALLAFLLLIYTLWISRDLGALDPNHLRDRNVHQSTKIYDRTGTHLLYEFFTDQRRTLVTLDKIPKYLQQGVIATEDKTFYTNHGVRFLSIGRAIAVGVFTNKQIGGTSTLTQQLIKNAVLTNERSIDRKLKEIILSLRLTQKYSKDEILQIYFNEIPYGSTNYGVESAAQNYFGKTVSELTLEQCATLAGLPKAPSKYLGNPEALKNRRDFVLQRMFEENYITEQEMKDAQATPLSFSRRLGNITAPHFVFFVRDQLSQLYGDQMVDTGGLSVITTLDYDAQLIAEKSFVDNEKLMKDAGASNAALVSFDAKTSQIVAYVGSKDFMDKDINGQFDIISQARRQPGSSIKPIIYAAAFEKGYTPDTILFDVLTNFAVSGKEYKPQNYTLKEYGPVTMRQALQGSLNIPAVKTFYLVGEKKGIEFANRLGYTTFNDGNFGLSLVLGGGEVSMLEHVHAYSVFADNGVYNDPISILKVQDPKGEVLYEWKPTEGKQVLDPKVTATLSNVLSDDAARAYIFGAGSALTLPGRPVAAKTGTTNGYKDAWTVGYTPSYVTGVWAGNNDNTALKAGFGGGKVSGQIWNSFMKNFLQNKPVEQFPTPPVNDAEKPVLRGSSGGGITLGINSITGKIAVTTTPAEFVVQKTFLQPHDILHYVNKDDPRGPAPENPASDSQYSVWEAAIQDWITRRHAEDPTWVMSFEEPPTEFDTVQSPEFVPKLTVLFPQPGAVYTTRNLTTQIEVSAPRGVAKVSYFLDKKPIQIVTAFPFHLNIKLHDIENGPHELSIIAQDDLGNYAQSSIPISIDAGEIGPYVTWVRGLTSLSFSDFPATFFLNPSKPEQIRELRVFKQNPNGVREPLAVYTDFTNLTNGQIIVPWTDPASTGSWKLLTEMTDLNGVVSEGDTFEITVN